MCVTQGAGQKMEDFDKVNKNNCYKLRKLIFSYYLPKFNSENSI